MHFPWRSSRSVLAFAVLLVATAGTFDSRVEARTEPHGATPALGMEQFGHLPVTPQPDWLPGLVPVVDQPNLVYRRWINGQEDFYYIGQAFTVSQILWFLSQVNAPCHSVTVLPTQGITRSFDGAEIHFDWHVSVPGGIVRAVLEQELEKGDPRLYPSITVHVADNVKLEDLAIPDGVELVPFETLLAGLEEDFAAPDLRRQQRALTQASELGEVPEMVAHVVDLLSSPDDRLRPFAISALERLGRHAAPEAERIAAAILAANEKDRPKLEAALDRALGHADAARFQALREGIRERFGD